MGAAVTRTFDTEAEVASYKQGYNDAIDAVVKVARETGDAAVDVDPTNADLEFGRATLRGFATALERDGKVA